MRATDDTLIADPWTVLFEAPPVVEAPRVSTPAPVVPVSMGDAAFAHDREAIAYYAAHGCNSVAHAYALGNILHTNRRVREAAEFYGIAFAHHAHGAGEYPLPQSLLQARLLCLLKAGGDLDDAEIATLRRLCPGHADYIEGIRLSWRGGDHAAALVHMKNAFEGFHTGEEADALYLETAVRAGVIAPLRDAAPPAIPPALYMYWDRDPPPEIAANIAYHQALPGLTFHAFDHEEAAQWLYDVYGADARSIFLNARHPAEAADILRVHVIEKLGGWWLDADIRLRHPDALHELARGGHAHMFFTTDNNYVHNDFFGSVAGTPLLGDCLLSLYRNCFQHERLFIAYKTGPGIFNRAVNRAIRNQMTGVQPLPAMRIADHHAFWAQIEEFDTPYKTARPSWQSV